MKKRLACGMGLMMLICGLSGCASAQKEQAPKMQESGTTEGFQGQKEDSAEDQSEKETERANLQTETAIQRAYEALEHCTVDFTGNHPIDEAFLDWFLASYGEETLEGGGVPYVGAGRNLEEAKKIVYFIANGRKIAITAASQIERSSNYTKEATEDSPGVLKTLNPDKYIEVIKTAGENSDIVIAYVHWGTEHQSWYGADQESLADAFVDAGVDVIIGGHTHCLQGLEYKGGVPILYSLGNFWFNRNTLDTGLAQVVIEKDGSIDFRFLPCIQQNYKTMLVTGETEKQRILDYMKSISSGVGIDEDGYVTDLSEED